MSSSITMVHKLHADEPGRQKLVMESIAETVLGSFLADKARTTQSEIQRRIEITAGLYLEIRHELGWSTVRTLDELPKALRCKLDGADYAPTREGKSSWSAENGRDLIYLPGA